jgi:hypothetical protein
MNLFRVMAIADALNSQITEGSSYCDQEDTEFHSLDYYACYQYLIVNDCLKVAAGVGAFGMGKASSRVSEFDA